MYVNLYPGKQLQSTKRSMLLLGLFLVIGGGYALLREFLWVESFREGWAIASVCLVLLGLIPLAYGTEVLRFKDAFFSMTPDRIVYRVGLLGPETVVEWQQIQELHITAYVVKFILKSGHITKMRLNAIQRADIARHVSRSIHLAALQQGIMINGVKATPTPPAMQV